MLYIKNNLDYAINFIVDVNGIPQNFEFDCLRHYNDTGNIATTGVTPISEDDLNLLIEKNHKFRKYLDKGYLTKTKESGATSVAQKMNNLEKENEILKAQLEKKTKEASNATSEELEETKAENADLKSQLEGLTKKKTTKKAPKPEVMEVDDSESF